MPQQHYRRPACLLLLLLFAVGIAGCAHVELYANGIDHETLYSEPGYSDFYTRAMGANADYQRATAHSAAFGPAAIASVRS